MEPFISHTGRGVPLRRSNVDTDQIIPADYLKRVTPHRVRRRAVRCLARRPGVRAEPAPLRGRDDPDRGDRLRHRLVARARGLGLADYGFRAVIAPRFGDIFWTNATKAGLLPVRLPADVVSALQDAVEADPATQITVDLGDRSVSCPAPSAGRRLSVPFEIDDYTRWRLMEGLDDIGLTLRNAGEITEFERRRPSWLPVTS